MLFAVGTKVRLIHTGDIGEVVELLDNGMVSVLLEDEVKIPAFLDDLERIEATAKPGRPAVKAKFVKGKQEKIITPPKRPPIISQYAILKSLGIQLAFDPKLKSDATAEQYSVYLINDTKYDVLYRIGFSLNAVMQKDLNGKLDATSAQEIGMLLFDQLNDAPVFDVQCWRISTLGTGSRMQKTIKIKPKQFFKNTRTAPILNRQVHHYKVFEKVIGLENAEKKEDLKSYTKRNARPQSRPADLYGRLPHEVVEMSEFIPEIDLHIEKLRDDFRGLNKADILRIQLKHFDAYLERAIRLGVERVFIIHGVGEGRLRSAIATRLLRNPDVETFKNEFHPRYGYGATEVIF